MTVDLWTSNLACLRLIGPDGARDVLLAAPTAVVVRGVDDVAGRRDPWRRRGRVAAGDG